jgi:nucleolar MIF4G domain-containing protein 1
MQLRTFFVGRSFHHQNTMGRDYTGPTLPKTIRDQIGGKLSNICLVPFESLMRTDPALIRKNGRTRPGQPLNRKDRRKAEREATKKQKQQPRRASQRPPPVQNWRSHVESDEHDDDSFGGWSEEEEEEEPKTKSAPAVNPAKGILKKTESQPKNSRPSLSPSPPPPPQASRAVKDKLAQDDAEIKALEKRLGVKGKKRKAKGAEDSLDDIFGDLGGVSSDEDGRSSKDAPKRKRAQDEEWLASKRRKALGNPSETAEEEDSGLEGLDSDEMGSEELGLDGGSEVDDEDAGSELMEDDDNSDIEQFEDEEEEEEVEKPRVRENPYVAPVAPGTQPTKYVPPALRGPPSSDAEALSRLRRQVQGLLNRLSDANLITILKDVEQIYQNNPRGYVTTVLIDLLIGLLSDETTLPDTFLILHAGFIAAIYKVIGPDFGAQTVERIVFEFDKHLQRNKEGFGKHTTNLMTVLAELYVFQLVGSKLVFDYIRLFLDELSEINTELLLRLVRVSGSLLRQDDPSSLKDIVLLLQKSVAKAGQETLPVRTKYMIETINDLKNNKMKTGVAASNIASEHIIRMKKQLGTLNTRNLKGTEPLRIGLTDIRDTDKKGKWWLVGASWRNDTADAAPTRNEAIKADDFEGLGEKDDGEVDLFQLAREQRMNTDVRRAIFISIMSATDFKEAHVRLLKLNLKKAQELEIPRVIVHCAGLEDTYNPYYTLLARKFCSDHRTRKCFQFALWDVFKSLGEKRDDEDDDASEDEDSQTADTSLRRLVNLGKLYGTLIAKDGLPITSLKHLNFPYLKSKTKTFVEIMLVTVILETQKGLKAGRDEKKLLNVFINVDRATEMITGLQYFVKKRLSKTEITATKKEKETVKWACKLVMDMLQRLMASATMEED